MDNLTEDLQSSNQEVVVARLISRLDQVTRDRDELLKAQIDYANLYTEALSQNALLLAEVESLRKLENLNPLKNAPTMGPELRCLACGNYHHGRVGLPCPNITLMT